jgi:bifunctional DNA-binding transcriptional regulator/antitoxin component of YhaV-PrlF toxin-antitoxin module
MASKTYASRYTRVGTSAAVIIPKAVRDELGLIDKDLMVMRIFGKLLILRRLSPNEVVDVSSIPTDAIPSAVRG